MLAQALMDAEVSAQIGATHGQRTPQRLTHRNGYRPREWDTRVGTIELAIPRLRQAATCRVGWSRAGAPSGPSARWRPQCYVEGVSTRQVDDIARQMGIDGSPSRKVSRICGEFDVVVAAWRNRRLDQGPYAFVSIDALSMRVRKAGRIVNTAVLVATEREEELACAQASLERLRGQAAAALSDAATVRELLATFPIRGGDLPDLGKDNLRDLFAGLDLFVATTISITRQKWASVRLTAEVALPPKPQRRA